MIKDFWIDVLKILKKLKDKDWNFICDNSSFKITKGGSQIALPCPFHDDKSPSLWINTEINRYNCFVCTNRVGELKHSHPKSSVGKGTFVNHFFKAFFELHHNRTINLKELADFLEIEEKRKKAFYNYFKERLTSPEPLPQKKIGPQEKNIKVEVLKQYIPGDRDYLVQRMSQHKDVDYETIKNTLRFFYIGEDKDKSVTIPIWQDWYLKGIYARSSKPGWKYFNIEYFKKSNHIYNYDEIKKLDEIILVEGPLNCIRLWSLGYNNVCSLFWAVAYKPQIEKLKKFRKVTIWFDNDTAGKNGRDLLQKELDCVKLKMVITPEKYDAFDYNKQEIYELLKS